jgi:hypothetical protein
VSSKSRAKIPSNFEINFHTPDFFFLKTIRTLRQLYHSSGVAVGDGKKLRNK